MFALYTGSKSGRNSAALTLVEVLMAMAVASVIGVSVGIPLTLSHRSTRLTRCRANLQQVNQAVLFFAADHAQTLPGSQEGQSGELQWWYKEQVKGYAGIKGASSANDQVFACPEDRGYTDSRPFHQTARFDFGSYNFNGVVLPGAPNVAGWPISDVTEPKRTLLTMEWTAHGPLSWHRSRTGMANRPFYCDAESVVGFLDGHVDFTQIYYDGYNAAYLRDPIPGYRYRYSGK